MTTPDPHQEEHADGIVEDREQRPPAYFNVLFFGLILWAIVFIAYYLFSGWSSGEEFQQKMTRHQEQTAQPAVAATAAPAPAADGAALFAANCAMCHGADGTGGIGPDLTSADYIYGKDAAAIKTSISSGRPNGMPNFGNQFSAAEITALTEYLLSF